MQRFQALEQYRQVRTLAIEDTPPEGLIGMLFEGAMERLALARGHMERGEIAPKGEQIGRVIDILHGLRESLNLEAGGELAQNLENLYAYMQRCLLEANLKNDVELLNQVGALLQTLREAWDAVLSGA